jgi:hypothetical protein
LRFAGGRDGKTSKTTNPTRRRQPPNSEIRGECRGSSLHRGHPGWKREVGRRLDALIEKTVSGVGKAVKWNSPLYGVEGQGWFLGIHCFMKYVKVAFFRGASLSPVPPVASKSKDSRYLHMHEDDELDEELVASWIRQASELPGWLP